MSYTNSQRNADLNEIIRVVRKLWNAPIAQAFRMQYGTPPTADVPAAAVKGSFFACFRENHLVAEPGLRRLLNAARRISSNPFGANSEEAGLLMHDVIGIWQHWNRKSSLRDIRHTFCPRCIGAASPEQSGTDHDERIKVFIEDGPRGMLRFCEQLAERIADWRRGMEEDLRGSELDPKAVGEWLSAAAADTYYTDLEAACIAQLASFWGEDA